MINTPNIDKSFAGRKIHYPVLNPIDDFESWHFIIKTNNELVKVKFSMNENYNVPVYSSVSLWIIDKDFNEIKEKISIESKESFFSDQLCDVKIKNNWCINKGEYYELYVKINGNGLHVKLWPLYENWSPTHEDVVHTNLLGTKFLGWNFPILHSKVEGILFRDNNEEEITGTGWLDHIWGNDTFKKELVYLQIVNFYFDNSVWVFYLGKDIENQLFGSIVGIDQDGEKYVLRKDYDMENIKIKLSEISDNHEIMLEFHQAIAVNSLDNKKKLKIEIGNRISRDLSNDSRLKADKAADFIANIELTIKENNLKKTYKTTTVIEHHTFID